MGDLAAAFGRLCVETLMNRFHSNAPWQPPSGGCVLKHLTRLNPPPMQSQPPSGGCVLKLAFLCEILESLNAAAFGRLCVETVGKT